MAAVRDAAANVLEHRCACSKAVNALHQCLTLCWTAERVPSAASSLPDVAMLETEGITYFEGPGASLMSPSNASQPGAFVLENEGATFWEGPAASLAFPLEQDESQPELAPSQAPAAASGQNSHQPVVSCMLRMCQACGAVDAPPAQLPSPHPPLYVAAARHQAPQHTGDASAAAMACCV